MRLNDGVGAVLGRSFGKNNPRTHDADGVNAAAPRGESLVERLLGVWSNSAYGR